MKVTKLLVGIASAALLVAACSSSSTPAPSAGGGSTDRAGINIEVVSHGQASDPFWSVVKNGVDAAAKDLGVKVNYSAPDTFDMVKMAQLIDAACAKKPSGLIISLPDAAALGPSVTKCIAAGIPVWSMNSGSDTYKDLGILAHVGQTEYEAGLGGGELMAKAGGTKAICVNQEVGNAALDLRCKGFTDGFTASGGGSVEVVQVNLSDATGAQQTVQAKLQSDPTIDTILTLGPTGAAPTIEALKALGQTGKIKLATFDLSPVVLSGILDGSIEFAIDQQQFIQGYLPVVFATLYDLYGTTPVGVVMTGPGIVTKANAQQVIDLSKQGIR
ncbi:MAG: sugar ABC transporter substrate-binding protein [Chloroflexota bacterium]